AGERARLEADVLSAGLEQHHGADGKRDRYARQEAADALVVPDPAALEIGQLEQAFLGTKKELLQRCLGAIEAGASHVSLPSPPPASAQCRPRSRGCRARFP